MDDLKKYLCPKGLRPSLSDLDSDELYAIESMACDDPETGEALTEWAQWAVRGRDARSDAWLLDRLEAIMKRAQERYQREAREYDGYADGDGPQDDPWEAA